MATSPVQGHYEALGKALNRSKRPAFGDGPFGRAPRVCRRESIERLVAPDGGPRARIDRGHVLGLTSAPPSSQAPTAPPSGARRRSAGPRPVADDRPTQWPLRFQVPRRTAASCPPDTPQLTATPARQKRIRTCTRRPFAQREVASLQGIPPCLVAARNEGSLVRVRASAPLTGPSIWRPSAGRASRRRASPISRSPLAACARAAAASRQARGALGRRGTATRLPGVDLPRSCSPAQMWIGCSSRSRPGRSR